MASECSRGLRLKAHKAPHGLMSSPLPSLTLALGAYGGLAKKYKRFSVPVDIDSIRFQPRLDFVAIIKRAMRCQTTPPTARALARKYLRPILNFSTYTDAGVNDLSKGQCRVNCRRDAFIAILVLLSIFAARSRPGGRPSRIADAEQLT